MSRHTAYCFRILLMIVLVVSIAPLSTWAQPTFERQNGTSQELARATSAFFSRLDRHDYVSAAKLFHYPPAYRPDELKRDIEGLADSLAIFAREFGDVQSHHLTQQMPQAVFASAGSGDLPYWKQYPNSVQVIESVSFKGAGPGFIVFVFNNVKGQPALSAIHYAVPDTPQGRQFVEKVASQLLNRMKARQNTVKGI